jgi:hypothetical protein
MTKEPQNVIGTIVRILNEYQLLAELTVLNIEIGTQLGVFAKNEPIFDPVNKAYIGELPIYKAVLFVREIRKHLDGLYVILETPSVEVSNKIRKPLNVDPEDINPIEYDTVMREGDLLVRM